MRSCLAFLKKEALGQLRSFRLPVLGGVFILLGVLGPAFAKLTPWLYETLADSMAESGLVFTPAPVTAFDAWSQFFKNLPIGLIAFVLLESGIFTREYRTGTLVLSLTKGLERRTVLLAKALALAAVWTACFWLSAGINWGCCEVFWDNTIARHLPFALLCWWVFGLWTVALTVLFSTVFRSNIGVMAGTGGVVILLSLLAFLPRVGEVLPTFLMNGYPLITGAEPAESFRLPLILTAAMIPLLTAAGIPVFDRKAL